MSSTLPLRAACDRFLEWLDREGYGSFDPYDIWGTRYGLWSRKVYYALGKPAIPLVAPLVAVDLLCPSMRKLFLKRKRYATCDAQLLLAFLNLYELTGDGRYLEWAVALGEEIMGYSIQGFRGPCWGYPFDWQNSKEAVWPKNTPYITCTPYCYEAFSGLLAATGDSRYEDRIEGIAEFVHKDLKDLPTGANMAAGSYSPFDQRQVVNATAYRAFVLTDAAKRLGREGYADSARRNLNFVLHSQAQDGSWFYAMNEGRSYIDNFHTCFNLKNLFKIHRLGPEPRIEESIRRGYDYYRENLIDPRGNPRPFAIKPRLQMVELEMYDFAEGITLGTLLGSMIPEALDLARYLAGKLISEHQLPDGHFVSRVFRGGMRHRFPFLRWPQAQLFYALTNLWKVEAGNDRQVSGEMGRMESRPGEARGAGGRFSGSQIRGSVPMAFPTNQKASCLGGLARRRLLLMPTWKGWILVGLVSASLGAGVIFGIHPFLAVDDRVPSEVIVVEGWVPDYVLKQGHDLSRTPDCRYLILTGGMCQGEIDPEPGDTYAHMAMKRLQRITDELDKARVVPASDAERDRTYSQALAVRDWLESEGSHVRRLNVVTMGPHARRSRLMFEKAFGPGMEIGVISGRNREYDPKNWWRTSEGVKEVLSEFAAYLYARFLFRPG